MGVHQAKGCVFNIQQFSVHDGPGIRTLVFLKGCPLRCRWCSNPESQQSYPELACSLNKCIGKTECGQCSAACPYEAIEWQPSGEPAIKREVCRKCFRCADDCPAAALRVFGKSMSVDEVLAVVEEDSVFYSRSGGGLTVSGGEPLGQPDFTIALLREARRRRIDTAMETSGYADWSVLEQACAHLNTIMYDIKCVDEHTHKQGTGVSNGLILENFTKLCRQFPDLPIAVRTPVIPGFNDSEEAVAAILEFIKGKPNVSYELLPYHRLGQSKYESLSREYPFGDALLDDKKMQSLQSLVKKQYAPQPEN